MANQDRVKLRVYIEGGYVHTIMTSRELAEEFRENWSRINDMTKIGIKGSVDHCDSNEVEFTFDCDVIHVVEILEVKGL